MNRRVGLYVLSRLLYAGFILISSIWCLLAWIPFTWQQVIRGHLFPPLSVFAASAHWINLVVLSLVAIQLLPVANRLSVRLFLLVQAGLSVFCAVRPVLANVSNSPSSLIWGLVLLVPLPWLSVLDYLAARPGLVWAPRPPRTEARVFYAGWRAAVFVGITYAMLPVLAGSAGAGDSPNLAPALLLWGGASHFVLYSLVFIAFSIAAGLASFFSRPARVEFLLILVFSCFTVYMFLASTVLPAMSFQGILAQVCSAAFAVSLILFAAAFGATLKSASGITISTGLDLVIAPITSLVGRGQAAHLIILPLLAFGVAKLTLTVAGFDWNYLGQEIITAVFWFLAFALFFNLSGLRFPRLQRTMPIVLAAGGLCVVWAAGYSKFAPDQSLQDYAGRNVSWRLIHGMLAPPAEDSAFYAFLNASSNIDRSMPVAPVNIELAAKLAATAAPKPNIFVFVIDSLRRDYVGAYNPDVTFTPALDAFAKENTAFPNAFTRYGGTGLAEPSIWIGGMTLHKQYITPFYPMNSLAKLANAEGYRQLVSMDNILDTVVPRGPRVTELDHDRLTMDFDLCQSLDELRGRLGSGTGPVFSYTQAQNIHISTIARQGKSVPEGESYPGFYAPYASRLRRIDACFGNFIGYLKASGLYDSSAVILTADHGDSLGEDGRWGHAYTIFPEIVRIPLLIHLPGKGNARSFGTPPNTAVFSSDITPTLFDLLGHPPTAANGMFGRSLLASQPNTPDYLVAASYAAVYGLVNRDGTRLFITDAVSARDYLYSLPQSGPASALTLQPEDTSAYKQRVRDLVTDLNKFYAFRPPSR